MRSDFKRAGIVICCRLAVAVVGYSLLASAWRHLVASPARWPLWVVVTATALVAGLLSITNRPITILADRLSFGERADSQKLMRELLARMSDTLPVGEVVRNGHKCGRRRLDPARTLSRSGSGMAVTCLVRSRSR